MADKLKLIIAAAIMVAAIALFYTYSEYSTLVRVIGLLAAAGLSVFVVAQTAVGKTAISYIGDTQVEVRKVVWPTRQDTIRTTIIVMIMTVIVAIMLWAFDSLLGWIVRTLTH